MRTLTACLILLVGIGLMTIPAAAQDNPAANERDRNKINTGNSGGPPAVVSTATQSHLDATARSTATTTTGTAMDVDVDTGSRASGAVDVDVTRTTDADTDAAGMDETSETGTAGDEGTLPDTASSMPLVGWIGLGALLASLALKLRRHPGH